MGTCDCVRLKGPRGTRSKRRANRRDERHQLLMEAVGRAASLRAKLKGDLPRNARASRAGRAGPHAGLNLGSSRGETCVLPACFGKACLRASSWLCAGVGEGVGEDEGEGEGEGEGGMQR
eukprot:567493-Pleurochrysis_carterae.AAC.1